jgi:hypothetical protein
MKFAARLPFRIFLLFAFALLLTSLLEHKTHARPVLLPVQQLHLELGPSGPTMRDLFGRFPASKTGGCPAPSSPVKQGITPLVVCKGIQCPFGSDPSPYGGNCQPNLTAKPVHACLNNTACTTYGCQSTSRSTCCGKCIWNSGDCMGCTTGDSGCNGH